MRLLALLVVALCLTGCSSIPTAPSSSLEGPSVAASVPVVSTLAPEGGITPVAADVAPEADPGLPCLSLNCEVTEKPAPPIVPNVPNPGPPCPTPRCEGQPNTEHQPRQRS
jgi:uncharacterized protein YceK